MKEEWKAKGFIDEPVDESLDLKQEIRRLCREKDAIILAHYYTMPEIQDIADFVGDSLALAREAAKTEAKVMVMCGVHFMAETCKILSPEKTVWLANPMAGCPMAEQLDLPTLQELKKQYPGYAVVAYINTTSELKTACDVCVTSSSALKICSALENDKILFIPDPNLGGYVAKQLPEKQFAFYHGGCPRHIVCSAADVAKARAAHPAAPRSWSRLIMLALPPALWLMQKSPMPKSSSSARKTASWSTSPMLARKSGSIRWPCSLPA